MGFDPCIIIMGYACVMLVALRDEGPGHPLGCTAVRLLPANTYMHPSFISAINPVPARQGFSRGMVGTAVAYVSHTIIYAMHVVEPSLTLCARTGAHTRNSVLFLHPKLCGWANKVARRAC